MLSTVFWILSTKFVPWLFFLLEWFWADVIFVLMYSPTCAKTMSINLLRLLYYLLFLTISIKVIIKVRFNGQQSWLYMCQRHQKWKVNYRETRKIRWRCSLFFVHFRVFIKYIGPCSCWFCSLRLGFLLCREGSLIRPSPECLVQLDLLRKWSVAQKCLTWG